GYQVLATVTGAEPGSQLEMANHLGVDRTVMTYLLDDLEQAGLIERHPDPADRRARRVVATARGCALRSELEGRLRAAEDAVLAGLGSPRDRAVFRDLLGPAGRARGRRGARGHRLRRSVLAGQACAWRRCAASTSPPKSPCGRRSTVCAWLASAVQSYSISRSSPCTR